MFYNLTASKDSVLCQFVSEIRDTKIQTDRLRFRKNMERIGEVIAYEISKELKWKSKKIRTPLAELNCKRLANQPVLATILRAGVSLHNGLLNYFDKADCAFISAYRKHDDKGEFNIELEYLSCPKLDNKTVVISDPMLATGSSMVLAIKALMNEGKPQSIHVACAIASQQGIDYVEKKLPEVTIWAAAIDPELNDKYYIVPGLGDAGDLAFGSKKQN